jgi:glycosyltransferase involved in cell wall biosynthesis
MKVVFATDHRFLPYKEAVYSKTQFPASLWERYLTVFDSIRVLAREDKHVPAEGLKNYEVSSRDGVTFDFVPDLTKPKTRLLKALEARERIRQSLSDADALIARLPSETGLVAIREMLQQGKPWAVEVAGCPWDGLWNYGTWQGKLYAPIMYWRTRSAVAKSPFALYVTQRFLQKRYPSYGIKIGCSDVEIPQPSADVLERRLSHVGCEHSPMVLGLIGTLSGRIKGIQTVLQALAQLRDKLPPLQFRVLGGGDATVWQQEARKYGVADLVRFDGVLPSGAPVFSWLDEIDIYLQPSFKEGLPRALVEAMSRGCPALASNCAGIPELLEAGSLLAPGDVSKLASLLQRATESQEWRAEQAKRNWEVSKGYSKERLETRRNEFWQTFAAYCSRSPKGRL